ncbi:c-type cytochrome [Thalassotalea ponticola]|uniref:c-type cytochrome n=1 Tax=Thalassotalea ponticola TaxID=1523392 RepID=UPI0025B3DF91|nr:c-type cytochrome [Thalassotalea ponticola]MDN3653317.1 c-type cytochrome [Thalassotalea ponticola]
MNSVSIGLLSLLCIVCGVVHANTLNDELIKQGKQQVIVCQSCHQLNEDGQNNVGPPLWGLAHRDIASAKGFQYSDALDQLSGNWTAERLDQFLQSPQQYAPGTNMLFPGIKDTGSRAAIIAWLGRNNDPPVNWLTGNPSNKTTSVGDGILAADENMPLVASVCSSCHSLHLVTQQGLSRESWQETLQWMIDEQGMQPLSDENNKAVLDYLSTYYGL